MKRRLILQHILTLLILAILLVYTYVEVFLYPFHGFYFNNESGEILDIYSPGGGDLNEGDIILRIGQNTWQDYLNDPNLYLFEGYEQGDQIEVEVAREGQTLVVRWTMPSRPGPEELITRWAGLWILSYIFWAAGLATVLLIRPIELRQELLVAFFYLTAVWFILGAVNWTQLWYSALLFNSILWFCIPVYLHLHWVFPEPIKETKFRSWLPLYLGAGILAIAQWFQLLPSILPALALLLAMVGSLVLLTVQFIRKNQRREIAILGTIIAFSILPFVITIPFFLFGTPPIILVVTLYFLTGLPGAYFYIAYRRQSGWLELRTNRLVAVYLFLTLLFLFTFISVMLLTSFDFDNLTLSQFVLVVTAVTMLSIFGFSPFRRWIENNFLGMPIDRQKILETYIARIPSKLERQALNRFLGEELFPSLQIQQTTIIQVGQDGNSDLLFLKGVEPDQIPNHDWQPYIAEKQPVSLANPGDQSWVKLILPFQLENKLQGVFLFGRKDPDDIYSRGDLNMLQIMVQQTAIALSNIQQTELLRKLYTNNILREEEEQTILARSLHDEVLNDLIALSFHRGDYRRFNEIHSQLIRRLRFIVRGLRPAELAYGLWRALNDLCQDIEERLPKETALHFEIAKNHFRYPNEVEQHFLRISQQAIENALAHSQAQNILIRGQFSEDALILIVEDDGIGMGDAANLNLAHLLENKHFGIVGMVERAELIDADLNFETAAGQFTRVTLNWSQPAASE